jgi:tetratricopeptide (TPR) repeat protein
MSNGLGLIDINNQFMAQTTLRARTHTKSDGVTNLCNWIIKISLYSLVFLVPVFFLPYTSEFLEFNKQNLLVFLTLAAVIAWLGKSIAAGVFEFKKSALNIPIFVFLVVYGVSAFFSLNRFASFIGSSALESTSFITVFCFVMLYMVILNNFGTIEKIRQLLTSGLISAFVVGLFSLFQMFGKFILPMSFTKSATFNTIGTVNSVGIFCAVILAIAVAYLLSLYAQKGVKVKSDAKNIALTVFLWLLAALMFLIVLLVDYWPIWVGVILSMITLLAFNFTKAHEINQKWLMLPMILVVVSVLFIFINLQLNLNLAAEVSPSYGSSWQIAKGALQDKPLLGSGPNTFVYDYAKFRPQEINDTIFWSLKFDRAIAHFMTVLATTGIFGFASWLILFGAFIYLAVTRFLKSTSDSNWLLGVGLFGAWLILFVSKFLYASNFTLEFYTWLLLALIAVFSMKEAEERVFEFDSSPKAGLLVSFIFIIVLTVSAAGLYLIGQRYAADAYYIKGLKSATAPEKFDDVNKYLSKAAQLNKYNDVYFSTLGRLYVTQLETEANKYNSAKEEDRPAIVQKIQALTSGAVAAAKRATEISPLNVSNFSILGAIYQKIAGFVPGAEDKAIEAYQKALELEPNNPSYSTEIGKLYLYKYDYNKEAAKAAGADKTKLDADAETYIASAYENINKAIELKNSYAPAHFQMSVYHVRKNDLTQAISEMEKNFVIYSNDQQLNSDDVGALFQLGLLYYQNKDKDKAIAAFEQVVKWMPNYSNARWYLAAVYEEQGKTAEAIAQIEKVLELNPDNQTVKDKLVALKSGKSKPAPPLPEPVDTENNQ